MGTIGIPTKLLHEALGHVVTLELKGGQSYRGKLFDAEDNLNCSLKEVILTQRDGKQSHLDSVYIRGSMIRFIVVPDMLQQAPMFKRVGPNAMKGRGIGAARGRATIMRGESARMAAAMRSEWTANWREREAALRSLWPLRTMLVRLHLEPVRALARLSIHSAFSL